VRGRSVFFASFAALNGRPFSARERAWTFAVAVPQGSPGAPSADPKGMAGGRTRRAAGRQPFVVAGDLYGRQERVRERRHALDG
jgi:hypothetical protein